MDRQKSKKIRNARIIATNIFMSITVVAIVFVLMLVAMGFTFNESGKLEQAGLLKLSSHPSGASVQIDKNNQFNHTEFSKMLSAGTHDIQVTKQGYTGWSKKLKIDAGLLTRIEWARLFPENATANNVRTLNELRLANFSADRKQLIAIEKDKSKFYLYNIQSDGLDNRELSLAECLSSTDKQVLSGDISIIAWNEDNSKIILKWTKDESTTWHLVDLSHPDKSINLSKTFNLNFDSILIANDGANKLWALENGNLRLIDTNRSIISGAIASSIVKITNNKETVAFVRTDSTNDDGKSANYSLNIFKEGESNFSTITKFDKLSKEVTIRLMMETYWSDEWISYSIDGHLTILKGKYPNSNQDNQKTLKDTIEIDLGFTPQLASVNANRRIIVLANESELLSYDIETDESYKTALTAELANINWLDDYLFWYHIDDSIISQDFDGDNRRTIVSKTNSQLPVVISENNKYLYYFDILEQETSSKETQKPSDSDPNQSTKTSIKYVLKRIKLE